MARLLFLSRLAFICNICFLLTFLMRYLAFMPDGAAASTIIVLGIGLSFFINCILFLFSMALAVTGRLTVKLPFLWLIIANFLFLIFQITLLLK